MAGQVEDGGEYPSSVGPPPNSRASDRRGSWGFLSRPSVFDGSFLISHGGTIYFVGFPAPLAQSAPAFPGFVLVYCVSGGEITCSCG